MVHEFSLHTPLSKLPFLHMYSIKPILHTIYTLLLITALFIPQRAYSLKANEAEERGDITVINAMSDELGRSQKKLKLEGYEAPYFISYQIKDNAYTSIQGKYGAIVDSDTNRIRRLYVDVRVGDYEFDNSVRGRSGGLVPFHDASSVPLDNDPDAIRAVLWQATDHAYKEALTQDFNKKATIVQEVKDEDVKSFTREDGHTFYGPELDLKFDRAKWEDRVREISSVYKAYKDIINGDVIVTAQ